MAQSGEPALRFAFLRDRARPYLGELLLVSGLSLVSALATLTVPWLASNFLSGVLGDAAIDLGWNLLLLIAALVTVTVTSIVVAILSEQSTGRILAGLRRETYDHIQAMPISFHDRARSGELLTLMTNEVDNLSRFLTATLANIPAMLMTAVGAVVLLFLLDPVMALVVPVLVPVFFGVMKLIGRRLRIAARRLRKAEVRLMWKGDSDLEMLPAIKAYAAEDYHRRHYHAAIEKARQLKLAETRMSAFVGPLAALLAGLAAIAILLLGSRQVADGARTPGELIAFLLYAALLTRPISALADTYGSFQRARGTLARLAAVIGKPAEPGYAAARRLARATGAIAFEQVSFSYPGRPPLLTGLNLAIAPGEVVALTGANGVGKSTLIRLLLRYYDPQAGRITLDGIDIAELQVQDLRRQFGYVPQRPLLFNASVCENIAFGIDEPDPAALERAINLAQAGTFIAHLPRGLDTEIGDDAIRLSGGQQQRVALARALYRDPPIYILDEATSMYDLEGEAAFVEACIEALAGRTVIIITHRPASLALASRVIHADSSGFAAVSR
jgi:ATP-binding cassette subfamily B protein/subfamily B ATP-binding cassette protein MsbA